MMNFKFDSALAHALSYAGKPGPVSKVKQLEALKCLYVVSDDILWILLATASLSVFRHFPSCLMKSLVGLVLHI